MEQFHGRQNLGCRACGGPVMTLGTSGDHRGNTFSDLVPVVSTSVLLSAYYPQFTGKNLGAKITSGDIYRGFRNFHGDQAAVRGPSEMTRSKCTFPDLHNRTTITMRSRRLNNPTAPTSRFFADLEQLQRQLISGSSRRKRPLPPTSETSIQSSANTDPGMGRDRRSRDVFFPPVLDVWAQNDAMQRSLLQRR